jgi:hypothetical protein
LIIFLSYSIGGSGRECGSAEIMADPHSVPNKKQASGRRLHAEVAHSLLQLLHADVAVVGVAGSDALGMQAFGPCSPSARSPGRR